MRHQQRPDRVDGRKVAVGCHGDALDHEVRAPEVSDEFVIITVGHLHGELRHLPAPQVSFDHRGGEDRPFIGILPALDRDRHKARPARRHGEQRERLPGIFGQPAPAAILQHGEHGIVEHEQAALGQRIGKRVAVYHSGILRVGQGEIGGERVAHACDQHRIRTLHPQRGELAVVLEIPRDPRQRQGVEQRAVGVETGRQVRAEALCVVDLHQLFKPRLVRLEGGDTGVVFGPCNRRLEIVDQMAEEALVLGHGRFGRGDQRRDLRFDRIAFGLQGLVSGARGIEFAAVDPAQLHGERIAHDLEADADQEAPPLERRPIVERHRFGQRHAGESGHLVVPDVNLLARRQLRRACGLLGMGVILRQAGCSGRHRRAQGFGMRDDRRLKAHEGAPRIRPGGVAHSG